MSKQETIRLLGTLITIFDNYNNTLDKFEERIKKEKADKKAA